MILGCLVCLAGLAFAPRAGAFLYWSSNANGLVRAGNDGSGLGFFVQTPPESDGLAIDDAYVYWTTRDGRIGRANLDGSEPQPNFITGLPGTVQGLAVNSTGIYWSDLSSIGRANLDGSGVQPHLIAGNHPTGMAADDQHIYWGENEIGSIGRASLDGSGVDLSFIPAPGDPCSVAVDSAHVYWSDGTGNRVGRANLDGSGVEPSFVPSAASVTCGVAVSGSHLYFGTQDFPAPAAMARVNLDGTDLQSIFSLGSFGAPFVQLAVNSLKPPSPPSSFEVVGQVHNKRRGTVRIKVDLGSAGKLKLSGRQIKKVVKRVTRGRLIVLEARPKGKLARRLRRDGAVRTKVVLRFTATGGATARKTERIRFVKS